MSNHDEERILDALYEEKEKQSYEAGDIHPCGNELTEKEVKYDHCLKCSEYLYEM